MLAGDVDLEEAALSVGGVLLLDFVDVLLPLELVDLLPRRLSEHHRIVLVMRLE